jgi:ribosomal protein L11 methyltransferase
VELAPDGFEERETDAGVELVAYGEAAARVLEAFPAASCSEIADGWEDGWRRFHRGVRIGPLWVGPPWEAAPADCLPVVIDPGRAFGTGAHATTRLCLELLLELPRGGLLDIGCGSGVLAIAAARLGFEPVSAVDTDDAAVAATLANAAANRVAVEARRLDATVDSLPEAEVAVANISLEEVEALAGRLHARRLVTSGYLTRDEPRPHGYRRLARLERDGWAGDLWGPVGAVPK